MIGSRDGSMLSRSWNFAVGPQGTVEESVRDRWKAASREPLAAVPMTQPLVREAFISAEMGAPNFRRCSPQAISQAADVPRFPSVSPFTVPCGPTAQVGQQQFGHGQRLGGRRFGLLALRGWPDHRRGLLLARPRGPAAREPFGNLPVVGGAHRVGRLLLALRPDAAPVIDPDSLTMPWPLPLCLRSFGTRVVAR